MCNGEIDLLISECVRTKNATKYEELFSALYGCELFFNFTLNPFGTRELTLYRMGMLGHVIQFFTSRTHPHLLAPLGGIQWSSALEMILKMPEVDGFSIRNKAEDWVVYSSDAIRDRFSHSNRL